MTGVVAKGGDELMMRSDFGPLSEADQSAARLRGPGSRATFGQQYSESDRGHRAATALGFLPRNAGFG